MNTWETLVASALVGTSRQEPSIDLTHPALSDYAAQIHSQSATQQILSAAGLIATYQAVGKSAEPASLPLLPPAAADNLPCCSKLTAQHLSAILTESRYEPILPELLQLLAQARQTVPPDFLPLLLNLGKRERKLRELILPILGDRGQWLVRQNPDWEYALGAAIASPDLAQLQEFWTTGTRSERLAALTQWRQMQPAEARQAVVASWKQDKADDRQAWLEVLQTGLSLEDEEFLEVALFDRSELVRYQSANLLRQLPSQYRQRSTKLASKYLTIKTKGSGYKIAINLPLADDKELQAAGVSNKHTMNNRLCLTIPEWQLLQVISAADLDIWEGDIDRLIQAAIVNKEHHRIVLTGWMRAACDQKRLDWIEMLLTRSHSILTNDDIQEVLRSLPPESDLRERFFLEILAGDNYIDLIHYNINMMITCHHNWSPQLSRSIVQQFHKYIHFLSAGEYHHYYQENLYDMLGQCQYLDLSVLPDLQQMQAALPLGEFNYNTCIEILEFRRAMRSAVNTI